jgi:hypothetical protein
MVIFCKKHVTRARSIGLANQRAPSGARCPELPGVGLKCGMRDDLVISFDRALRTWRTMRPPRGSTLTPTFPTRTFLPRAPRRRRPDARQSHWRSLPRRSMPRKHWSPATPPRAGFAQAAREEEEHLAWTQSRLTKLDDRASSSIRSGLQDRSRSASRPVSRATAATWASSGNRATGRGHLTLHLTRLPEADRKIAPSLRRCATTRRIRPWRKRQPPHRCRRRSRE